MKLPNNIYLCQALADYQLGLSYSSNFPCQCLPGHALSVGHIRHTLQIPMQILKLVETLSRQCDKLLE